MALGVVATPPAAILAFVDLGRAKATACGPVLSAGTAEQQRTAKGSPIAALGAKGDNQQTAAKPHRKFLGIF